MTSNQSRIETSAVVLNKITWFVEIARRRYIGSQYRRREQNKPSCKIDLRTLTFHFQIYLKIYRQAIKKIQPAPTRFHAFMTTVDWKQYFLFVVCLPALLKCEENCIQYLYIFQPKVSYIETPRPMDQTLGTPVCGKNDPTFQDDTYSNSNSLTIARSLIGFQISLVLSSFPLESCRGGC